MAKIAGSRSAKTGQFTSVGRASDGVVILEQVPKSRHFTLGRAERVMTRVSSEPLPDKTRDKAERRK